MANLSSAFGQITIKAKSIEAIKNLIILQKEFEKTSCYETNLNSFYLNENELNKQIKEHSIQTGDDYFIYKDDFTAIGRWSFESNVSGFLDSLEYSYTDSEQIKQLKKNAKTNFTKFILTSMMKNLVVNLFNQQLQPSIMTPLKKKKIIHMMLKPIMIILSTTLSN